jgi:hypothetical protein
MKPVMTTENKIWVLLYRVDWFKGQKIHPDVHTYCFHTEAEAMKHLSEMAPASRNKYWIKKTYLQEPQS